jgi:hypothetical protein
MLYAYALCLLLPALDKKSERVFYIAGELEASEW